MTIGQKIKEIRKRKGVTLAELSISVGLTAASLSDLENDKLKGGPDPDKVVRISSALADTTILLHYLEENPVYKAVIPRIFPDLNNIRREPAIIFGRLAVEMEEATESARILEQIFSNAEPERTPNFKEVFKAKMEQIVDVMRGAEILFLQLISAGAMTEEDRQEIHDRQQRKCEDHGHHKRNGTEG